MREGLTRESETDVCEEVGRRRVNRHPPETLPVPDKGGNFDSHGGVDKNRDCTDLVRVSDKEGGFWNLSRYWTGVRVSTLYRGVGPTGAGQGFIRVEDRVGDFGGEGDT